MRPDNLGVGPYQELFEGVGIISYVYFSSEKRVAMASAHAHLQTKDQRAVNCNTYALDLASNSCDFLFHNGASRYNKMR